MIVMQLPFEWHPDSDAQRVNEVVLKSKTVEAVVVLMASTMIAVVRGAELAEETSDER
jgi:hypothetical protein